MDGDEYRQQPIALAVLNDRRNLDLQEIHKAFLSFAQHKLNDDKSQREYQSLTIAVPSERIPELKQKIRGFIKELNEELSDIPEPNMVVNVMCVLNQLADKVD